MDPFLELPFFPRPRGLVGQAHDFRDLGGARHVDARDLGQIAFAEAMNLAETLVDGAAPSGTAGLAGAATAAAPSLFGPPAMTPGGPPRPFLPGPSSLRISNSSSVSWRSSGCKGVDRAIAPIR